MDIEPLRNAYWSIVADCLERFHGYERVAALRAAADLRHAIESPRPQDAPPGYDSELFFHSEPFYVACDIAGRELDSGAYDDEYEALARLRYQAAEERLQRQGSFMPAAFASA